MYAWTAASDQRPRELDTPKQWLRVSRSRRCPICNKPDWCSISDDGAEACCMRVGDGSYRSHDFDHGTGYYHRVTGDAPSRPTSHQYGPSMPLPAGWLDFAAIVDRWKSQTTGKMLDHFAAELGVQRFALEHLDACFCHDRDAWGFPMHNDRRQVVGIRLRAQNGKKFALPGSASGIFIPSGIDSRSMLLICEGPTDTAAALSLGYMAIGRPSNSGGAQHICDMLAVGRTRRVAIIADNDGPGRHGAHRLADQILGLCECVQVTTAAPWKDLREWVREGATRIDLKLRIDQTPEHGVSR